MGLQCALTFSRGVAVKQQYLAAPRKAVCAQAYQLVVIPELGCRKRLNTTVKSTKLYNSNIFWKSTF